MMIGENLRGDDHGERSGGVTAVLSIPALVIENQAAPSFQASIVFLLPNMFPPFSLSKSKTGSQSSFFYFS